MLIIHTKLLQHCANKEKLGRIVCGIVSLLLAIVSWFIFWWLSIVAIAIGIVGLLLNGDVDENNTKDRVLVGTILNNIGIIVAEICSYYIIFIDL